MKIERYSAVPLFGVPLNPGQIKGNDDVRKLLIDSDVEPEEVPTEPTDITPFYWRDPNFRYWISRPKADGPAVVELLPNAKGAETHLMGQTSVGNTTLAFDIAGIRKFTIPESDEALVIAGGSPRFTGQICVHELVIVAK